MNTIFSKKTKGFTLIETMISIGILTILSTITVVSLASFRENQSVSNTVDDVVALVNQARSKTLNAEAGTNYGVHFDTNEAVLFSGSTYSSGAVDNVSVEVPSNVEIASISLQGGGPDVVFDLLTGDTSNYGTLVVQRISSSTGARTLTISKAGAVSSD